MRAEKGLGRAILGRVKVEPRRKPTAQRAGARLAPRSCAPSSAGGTATLHETQVRRCPRLARECSDRGVDAIAVVGGAVR